MSSKRARKQIFRVFKRNFVFNTKNGELKTIEVTPTRLRLGRYSNFNSAKGAAEAILKDVGGQKYSNLYIITHQTNTWDSKYNRHYGAYAEVGHKVALRIYGGKDPYHNANVKVLTTGGRKNTAKAVAARSSLAAA